MTSSYTTNKNIEKPANGDYNNTWSVPVNSDWDIIDKAFGGTTTLNAVGASGTVTLTTTQYQPPIIAITGTLTANVNYQLPSGVGGFWYIFNNTSGAFSILFSSAGGGSTVTIPQGYTVAVISDGTNIGLGTTNAALISSSYANPSWITSLAASKLTGTVSVANGGTGQTTYTDGQLLIGNTTGSTLTKATLTAGTGITITNSAGGITIASNDVGGTVTSVGMSVPSFLSVAPSTITSAGTFAVTLSGTALPVANGGTGLTSVGTSGNVLTSNGSAWVSSVPARDGWVQISSVPFVEASTTFSSIPTTYSDLLVVLYDVEADAGGSADISYALGTSTTFGGTITTTLFGNFGNLGIYIPAYKNDRGMTVSSFGANSTALTSPSLLNGNSSTGFWRVTGGVAQIRLTGSSIAGVSSGTAVLYGK